MYKVPFATALFYFSTVSVDTNFCVQRKRKTKNKHVYTEYIQLSYNIVNLINIMSSNIYCN